MLKTEALAELVLTNEEEKAKIYNTSKKPTQADEVTQLTNLEELNLNWTEKDLPERIRTKHVNRLHPYLGKYIPQLVEIFLRKYFKPGDTVLDPFCGSGTTLVQANEMGINAIGFDISAWNVILCKVKTGTYNIKKLQSEVSDILNKTETIAGASTNKRKLLLFDDEVISNIETKTKNEYLNAWFAKDALKEILIFRSLIENYEYADVLRVILSRSARSARLTTHFDLDWPKKPQTESYHCYKHNRICHPTSSALKFLTRYGLDTVKRIEEYSRLRPSKVNTEVYNVDSRYADCSKVNGVITSPPYVGIIDYHDQHKYAFNLFGLDDQSDNEIGPAKRGTSKKAKEDYKTDMAAVLSNCARLVKKGGKIVVVAGDKNDFYPEIGRMANLNLEDKVIRHVNRRTGRRSTEFFETVFIYTKH